jgi:hypothetical protein
MTNLEPCRVCGSDVRLEVVNGPARMGGGSTQHEVRRCTNPECKMNNPLAPKRMGEVV